jgi:hypothetical protein
MNVTAQQLWLFAKESPKSGLFTWGHLLHHSRSENEACRAEPAPPNSDQWSRSSTAGCKLHRCSIGAAGCDCQVLLQFATSPACFSIKPGFLSLICVLKAASAMSNYTAGLLSDGRALISLALCRTEQSFAAGIAAAPVSIFTRFASTQIVTWVPARL